VYRKPLTALRDHTHVRHLRGYLLSRMGPSSRRHTLLWRPINRHRIRQLRQGPHQPSSVRLLFYRRSQAHIDSFEPCVSSQILLGTSTWFSGVKRYCPKRLETASPDPPSVSRVIALGPCPSRKLDGTARQRGGQRTLRLRILHANHTASG